MQIEFSLKKILVLLLLLSSNICLSQDIHEIRELFIEARNNEKKCDSLNNYLISNYEEKNLFKGYYAVSLLLKSKFLKNPFKKYKFFKEGKLLLEATIKIDPSNIELIFLRYTVQKNIPDFLIYNQQKNADYERLKNINMKITEEKLKNYIINNLQTI